MAPFSSPISEFQEIILDSITDGVFAVDLDWRITYFNKAAEKITGISKDASIGRLCYEVFRTNVCDAGCLMRQTVTTGEVIRNIPVYIVRGDEKRIPVRVTTALLRDATGKIIGGVETFSDLSTVHRLRRELQKQHSFGDIVSKNKKMLELFALLPHVARSTSTVLIEGATGTGKELFARAIHYGGPRKNGPFIAVNCGALPDTLCESELFGYKAGAFTDAKKDKLGRFALAQDGTIFLDEIGDISPSSQARLLRALEQKVFEPLGSTSSVETNARVITATHRNLEELVAQGKFRDDLFYRINIFKLSLPPLSERKEDIPLLTDYFVERFRQLTGTNILGISRETMASLMLHDWPGNVRELENAIEHAFVLCQDELIHLRHLPSYLLPNVPSTVMPNGRLTLQELEKQAIQDALQRHKWKMGETALELGIDRNTLRRRIERLGITQTR